MSDPLDTSAPPASERQGSGRDGQEINMPEPDVIFTGQGSGTDGREINMAEFTFTGQGLTLYINNGFENHQRYHRECAQPDLIMIKEKFEDLTGNPVFVAQNVYDKAELNSYLEIFKSKLQQKNYDYIVVIISSHGRHTSSQNLLALEDLSTVDLFNDILYPLKDFENPKVLIFDAVTFGNDFGVYEPPCTPEGVPINGMALVKNYALLAADTYRG